jgi:hypothetical protein
VATTAAAAAVAAAAASSMVDDGERVLFVCSSATGLQQTSFRISTLQRRPPLL